MFKKISLIAYLISVAPCTCTSWNHLMTWKLNSRELGFTFHIIIVVVKEDNNKGPCSRRYSPHHVECNILLGCDTIQSSSNLQTFREGGTCCLQSTLLPRRWRENIPPIWKRIYTRLQGVTSQKTTFYGCRRENIQSHQCSSCLTERRLRLISLFCMQIARQSPNLKRPTMW